LFLDGLPKQVDCFINDYLWNQQPDASMTCLPQEETTRISLESKVLEQRVRVEYVGGPRGDYVGGSPRKLRRGMLRKPQDR
jgi:hypothetical protein